MGIAGSVAEAKQLAAERMDVVLMDYRLPDGTGAEATRAIKARWPSARVVMLTAVQDDETVLESIQAGADGYLTKDRAVDDVVAPSARPSRRDAPPTLGDHRHRPARGDGPGPAPERPPIEALTARELQVLQALAEGMATPDICETLFISRNTLRTHVQNIMVKLHVHSKLEAVTVGLRNRIIDPPRPDDRRY